MTAAAGYDLNASGFVPEIEMEVLGAILMAGQLSAAQGRVKPDHFLEPLHRRIFENMLTANERFKAVSLSVVYKLFDPAEADAWGTVLKTPLSTYLAQLASNTVYGAPGLNKSVPNLIQQWARVSVKKEAEIVASAAANPGAGAVELIRDATRALDDIASGMKAGGRGKTRYSINEASEAAFSEVEEAMHRGGGITGITYGLADINQTTGGMHPGEMVVLGARPGMCKTAFALSTSIKAAKAGKGVAFISLEMNAKTLVKRAITDIAYDWNVKVPYTDLVTGRVSQKDFEALVVANTDLAKLPIWIEEQSGLTLADLRVKVDRIREEAAQRGQTIDLLVVDYLQLLAASGRYAGQRVQEVTELSAGLRNFGREEGLAVLALSQLSRGVESRENKRPMLSDLRESGSIEQDADTVAFLYRESYYLEKEKGRDAAAEADRLDRLVDCQNKLEFIIAKQRMGAVKTIDLFVDVPCSAVRNAVRHF
jgi:replicative DNA helicase